MRFDTPEEALRSSIDRLRGLKVVGVMLRPELDDRPDVAGRWLSDCLNDDKREKLSLQQVFFILRKACEIGEHEGFNGLCALTGYSAAPVNQEAEIKALLQRAEEANKRATGLTDEALARMKAAGLKVGESA